LSAHLFNYVLYYAGWLACVLGPARGHAAAGTLVGLTLLGVHLALVRRPRDELALALAGAAIGVAVDTTQIALGTLRFDAGVVVAGLPPPWLVVIWMQFAATFHFAMRWLKGRPIASALFGALGGPLAFVAGERVGVVALHPERWASIVSLALLWSIALPALQRLAKRQDGRDGVGEYRWPARASMAEP